MPARNSRVPKVPLKAVRVPFSAAANVATGQKREGRSPARSLLYALYRPFDKSTALITSQPLLASLIP